MEVLEELQEAVENVIKITNKLTDETNAEIWDKAPIIIHQQLCSKLVKIMKENPKKTASEVPKAMDVLKALEVLEELHPKLNENTK